MTTFRVLDLRHEPAIEQEVSGLTSPEQAATRVLGEKVVRSGSSRAGVIAKVYYQYPNEPMNMVRLYRPLNAPSTVVV